MKLSYRWLGTMVDLSETTPEQIQDLLTFHAAEIEDIEHKHDAIGAVRTARVLSVEPHPDADRLRVCEVDAGEGPIGVVCGAPNVVAGQIVAFAPVGTTLTMPDGTALTLEARKVRGVVSNGMICAEDELGLGEDHDGILVLPEDTPVGVSFPEALKLCDSIFELSNIAITHRPDLWGHVGFARELSAILGRPLTAPEIPTREASEDGVSGDAFPITVESDADCPRYLALVVDGIENGPSPLWLRTRLANLGVRSIDRIVDLTNWVLLEQGQPLHAFDIREVRGGTIGVRRARDGETIKTLDDVDHTLTSDDLVIADGERPVAIAGVMGGATSGVRADTTSIVLEAATFDPVVVRRTAARLGLRTDASSRFEKGLDPTLAEQAALRFVALLKEVCPKARLVRPVADAYPHVRAPRNIHLPVGMVRRRLGLRVPDMVVKRTLGALGFGVAEVGRHMEITVPSWRAGKDVLLPEDLVEEVGRIRGYEGVPPIVPVAPMRPRHPDGRRRLERLAGSALSVGLGYREAKNYSFYGAQDAEALGLGETPHLALSHAYTEQQDRMIQTTAANLLRTAQRNMLRAPQGALWESSRVFAPRDGGFPSEVAVLGGVAWDTAAEDGGGTVFLNLVADVRALTRRLRIRDARMEADVQPIGEGHATPAWLHPGRCARVVAQGHTLGFVGEVAPAVRRAYDIEGRIAVFELAMDSLHTAAQASDDNYQALQRFPVVPFDVSLIAERKRPAQEIVDIIEATLPDHVRDVHCFDVYEGEGIDEGTRSLAFRCELFDQDKTLSGKVADKMRSKIIKALEAAGVAVRAG